MRRGFLLQKSLCLDEKVNKSTQESARPIINVSKGSIAIPSGPLPSYINTPDVGFLPSATNRVITSLPLPSQCLRGERSVTCILFQGMKEAILATPGFPAPLAIPFPSVYRLDSIEGAGLGMFATVDLDPGDLIACERPLMVCTAYMPISLRDGDLHPNQVLELAVYQMMSEDGRRAFLSLHKCKGNTVPLVNNILDTNSLPVGKLPGYDGFCCGVSKDISRVNHSCSPNACHRWDLMSFSFELRALKKILKGEQITIGYGNLVCPRSERWKMVQKWAFQCACPACSLTGKELKISEARRAVMKRIQDTPYDDAELNAWLKSSDATSDIIIKRYESVALAMEAEGLYVEDCWPVCYQRLCKIYCALENMEEARKWAKHAEGLCRAFTGKDGGWSAVAAAPQSTNWWGLKTHFGSAKAA